MPKRSRKRRVFKWAGLVVCILLVFTIVLSGWWNVAWSGGNYWGFVQRGGIGLAYHARKDEFRRNVERNFSPMPMFGWFSYDPGNQYRASTFIIPLWVPLLTVGAPTFLAWRRDRRIPPGHCQECGYNLTGNESGVCPECGTEIEET